MVFKLFTIVAFATLAAGQVSYDSSACLVDCMDDDDFNKCSAICIGISVDIMNEFDDCVSRCTPENTSTPDDARNCSSACIEKFNSQSPYSYENITDVMLYYGSNSYLGSKDLKEGLNQTYNNETYDEYDDASAGTILTFTGFIGLVTAVIAYQLS